MKVEQIEPPTSVNSLQKVLGLCNYVREHVPSYQKHAQLLYAKLRNAEGSNAPQA